MTALERCPPCKPALIGERSQVSYGEMRSFRAGVKEAFRTKNIALSFSDPVLGFLAAFALQGKAQSILLIPSDVNEVNFPPLLEEVKVDMVVTDGQVTGEQVSLYSKLIWSDLFASDPAESTSPGDIETKWLFLTSGSSGIPKIIGHSFGALVKSAEAKSQEVMVWSSLFDPMRFAGVQLFLHSVFTCSTLVVPNPNSSVPEKALFFEKNKCNAISATPSGLRALMACPEFRQLKLDQITVGGEVVTDDLLHSLRRYFHHAKLTHIYATTEAGVGFVVSDGVAGIPVSLFKRLANNIKICEGSIWVRGSRTASEIGQRARDSNCWLNTEDLVEIKGDRVFIVGRLSNVINVGGQKVRPEEVESYLIEFPQISIAKVYAKASPILGEVVVADVVLEPSFLSDHQVLLRQLREFLLANLDKYKVPVIINIVQELKLSRNAKIERR